MREKREYFKFYIQDGMKKKVLNVLGLILLNDTGFVWGNPNLTDMINECRLDKYILYFLVLWDKKNT